MATGEADGVVTYDGSQWSAPTQPAGLGEITSLSCTSPTFCLASGFPPGPIHLRRPDVRWNILDGVERRTHRKPQLLEPHFLRWNRVRQWWSGADDVQREHLERDATLGVQFGFTGLGCSTSQLCAAVGAEGRQSSALVPRGGRRRRSTERTDPPPLSRVPGPASVSPSTRKEMRCAGMGPIGARRTSSIRLSPGSPRCRVPARRFASRSAMALGVPLSTAQTGRHSPGQPVLRSRARQQPSAWPGRRAGMRRSAMVTGPQPLRLLVPAFLAARHQRFASLSRPVRSTPTTEPTGV